MITPALSMMACARESSASAAARSASQISGNHKKQLVKEKGMYKKVEVDVNLEGGMSWPKDALSIILVFSLLQGSYMVNHLFLI